MNNNTKYLRATALLRSSLFFSISSLVVAVIAGMASRLWATLPTYWTAICSAPIAVGIVITTILIWVRSKCPLYCLSMCFCVLGSMSVDLVPFIGFQSGLLAGVLLAQIGLLAAASLPSVVRLEKSVIWVLGTIIQTVWIYDVSILGRHISFFGPTMIR